MPDESPKLVHFTPNVPVQLLKSNFTVPAAITFDSIPEYVASLHVISEAAAMNLTSPSALPVNSRSFDGAGKFTGPFPFGKTTRMNKPCFPLCAGVKHILSVISPTSSDSSRQKTGAL